MTPDPIHECESGLWDDFQSPVVSGTSRGDGLATNILFERIVVVFSMNLVLISQFNQMQLF